MRNFIEKQEWFDFGTYPDGRVDIANSDNSSLIEGVPADLAARVIAAHNAALEAINQRVVDDADAAYRP
jgi:hypothetical protein